MFFNNIFPNQGTGIPPAELIEPQKPMQKPTAEHKLRLLIVFAKAPVAGQVKTRIGEVAGEEQAAMISEHMLKKILVESVSNEIWKQVVFIPPESDAAYFERQGLETMRQRGANLGERMSDALVQGVRSGASQVIIIGSDIPTLSCAELAEAFSLLDSKPGVIGPSADGGFYLFGIKEEHVLAAARVLRGEIAWSTSRVFWEVQAHCRQYVLPLSVLPVKRDIDTYEDWLDYIAPHREEN